MFSQPRFTHEKKNQNIFTQMFFCFFFRLFLCVKSRVFTDGGEEGTSEI